MNKIIIYIVLSIVLLGGAFYFIKPQSPSPIVNTDQQSPERVFELVVRDSKLFSGPAVLQVNQGDSVRIKITADMSDELHVHGYDKSVELIKDQPVELSFVADVAGRFPYELEEKEIDLGELIVNPK